MQRPVAKGIRRAQTPAGQAESSRGAATLGCKCCPYFQTWNGGWHRREVDSQEGALTTVGCGYFTEMEQP